MDNIRVLFSEKEIAKREQEIADELYAKYGDEEVVFICVLKGAVFFACDLAKKYKGDARIEFLRVSSYEGDSSTGKITLKLPLNAERIYGKHVVVIEDIIDTGYTLQYISKYLEDMQAKSITVAVMLDKKARRKVEFNPEHVGFEIPDLFVIGYGLDYDEKYRNLPYIGVVENN